MEQIDGQDGLDRLDRLDRLDGQNGQDELVGLDIIEGWIVCIGYNRWMDRMIEWIRWIGMI